MQNKTVVRTDELNLLIVGIRRALSLYDGELNISTEGNVLRLSDGNNGHVCEIKLSDNVNNGRDYEAMQNKNN